MGGCVEWANGIVLSLGSQVMWRRVQPCEPWPMGKYPNITRLHGTRGCDPRDVISES